MSDIILSWQLRGVFHKFKTKKFVRSGRILFRILIKTSKLNSLPIIMILTRSQVNTHIRIDIKWLKRYTTVQVSLTSGDLTMETNSLLVKVVVSWINSSSSRNATKKKSLSIKGSSLNLFSMIQLVVSSSSRTTRCTYPTLLAPIAVGANADSLAVKATVKPRIIEGVTENSMTPSESDYLQALRLKCKRKLLQLYKYAWRKSSFLRVVLHICPQKCKRRQKNGVFLLGPIKRVGHYIGLCHSLNFIYYSDQRAIFWSSFVEFRRSVQRAMDWFQGLFAIFQIKTSFMNAQIKLALCASHIKLLHK